MENENTMAGQGTQPEQNQAPQQSPQPANTPSNQGNKENTSIGPVVGIFIILAIIILGGLYFWGKQVANDTDNGPDAEEIMNQLDESRDELNNVSSSDVIADIEADLGSTDLDSLDVELGNIDSELSQ